METKRGKISSKIISAIIAFFIVAVASIALFSMPSNNAKAENFPPVHVRDIGKWLLFRDSGKWYYAGIAKMSGRTYAYCAAQNGILNVMDEGNPNRTWGNRKEAKSWTGWNYPSRAKTKTGVEISKIAFATNYYGSTAYGNAMTKAVDREFGTISQAAWPQWWNDQGNGTTDLNKWSDADAVWRQAQIHYGPYKNNVTIKTIDKAKGKYSVDADLLGASPEKHSPRTAFTAKIVTTGNLKMKWTGRGACNDGGPLCDTAINSGIGTQTIKGSTSSYGRNKALLLEHVSGSGTFFVEVTNHSVPDHRLYYSEAPANGDGSAFPKWGQDMFLVTKYEHVAKSATQTIESYSATPKTYVCVGTSAYCDVNNTSVWSSSIYARPSEKYWLMVETKNNSSDSTSSVRINTSAGNVYSYANTTVSPYKSTSSQVLSPGQIKRVKFENSFSGKETIVTSTARTFANILNTNNGRNVLTDANAKSTNLSNSVTIKPHQFKASLLMQVCKDSSKCSSSSDTGWTKNLSLKNGEAYTTRYKITNNSPTKAPILAGTLKYDLDDKKSQSSVAVGKIEYGASFISTSKNKATFNAANVSDKSYVRNSTFSTNSTNGNLSVADKVTINRVVEYKLQTNLEVCADGVRCSEGSNTGWAKSTTFNFGKTNAVYRITTKNIGVDTIPNLRFAGICSLDVNAALAPGKTHVFTCTDTNPIEKSFSPKIEAWTTVNTVKQTSSVSVSIKKTTTAVFDRYVCVGNSSTCSKNSTANWVKEANAKAGETVNWKNVVKYTGNNYRVNLNIKDGGKTTVRKLTQSEMDSIRNGEALEFATYSSEKMASAKDTKSTLEIRDVLGINPVKGTETEGTKVTSYDSSAKVNLLLKPAYTISAQACLGDAGYVCDPNSDVNWLSTKNVFKGKDVHWRVVAKNTGKTPIDLATIASKINLTDSKPLSSAAKKLDVGEKIVLQHTSPMKNSNITMSTQLAPKSKDYVQTPENSIKAVGTSKNMDTVESTAIAYYKDLAIEVMSAPKSKNPSINKDSDWSNASVIENKSTGVWRIKVTYTNNGNTEKTANFAVNSNIAACSKSGTITAGTPHVYTCESTLNSNAIENTAKASIAISSDPKSGKKEATAKALMMPETYVSEIEGGKTCPVRYDSSLTNQKTNKTTVETPSTNTIYGTKQTYDNCLAAMNEGYSFKNLPIGEYGRFINRANITFDNPRVIKKSVNAKWEIVENGALKPENMNTESTVRYSRLACKAEWSGTNSTTPYGDTVTRNGSSYTLTYTQNDCMNQPEQLRCTISDESTSVPASLPENDSEDFANHTSWITKNVEDPEASDTITVNRAGNPSNISFAVPDLRYGNYWENNGFSDPQITGVKRTQILKDKQGTPWDSNTEARNEPSIKEASNSSTKADVADFLIGSKDGENWIKKISTETINRYVPDDNKKYWAYDISSTDFASGEFSVSSRWNSDSDTNTKIRQKFDIGTTVTNNLVVITGIRPNGTFETSAVTRGYDTHMTCVSGEGNVKTVRSINTQ